MWFAFIFGDVKGLVPSWLSTAFWMALLFVIGMDWLRGLHELYHQRRRD
jgi:hypothetical protein